MQYFVDHCASFCFPLFNTRLIVKHVKKKLCYGRNGHSFITKTRSGKRKQTADNLKFWQVCALEMPVPSQGHYGFHSFHSFPVVDSFCLFIYL